MVKSTIDEIKDITLERQIRKLAGVIDEQNKKIEQSVDYSTDIENLKASDANQTNQINNLKQTVATDKLATEAAITDIRNKDTVQDETLTNHSTQIQDITESLVSGVQIMSGTTTGEIKVRLERESATAIDSNNYNLGLPVSAEIIQGTGPSMFKIQITMSSGVKVMSNDFVFTTEAIGTDVYISSFTFKAGNQSGYLSADIGLNNGVVIEANNFLVPTDPNVTSAITDLQNRMTTVESTGVAGLNELKTTVDGHTTSINELNTDVANLTTNKADVNNGNQSITAGTVNATNINKGGVSVATVNDIPDISGKVNIAQGTENAGKVLGIGVDGNVTPVDVGSSGEVWEEVDLANFPTDWAIGDRFKLILKTYVGIATFPTAWSSSIPQISLGVGTVPSSPVVEFIIDDNVQNTNVPVYNNNFSNAIGYININEIRADNEINTGDYFIRLTYGAFNGNMHTFKSQNIAKSLGNITTYIYKMWRCRIST